MESYNKLIVTQTIFVSIVKNNNYWGEKIMLKLDMDLVSYKNFFFEVCTLN